MFIIYSNNEFILLSNLSFRDFLVQLKYSSNDYFCVVVNIYQILNYLIFDFKKCVLKMAIHFFDCTSIDPIAILVDGSVPVVGFSLIYFVSSCNLAAIEANSNSNSQSKANDGGLLHFFNLFELRFICSTSTHNGALEIPIWPTVEW